MASLSPTQFSIFTKSLQTHHFSVRNSPDKFNTKKVNPTLTTCLVIVNKQWKLNRMEQGNRGLQRSTPMFRFLCTCHESVSSVNPKGWSLNKMFLPVTSSAGLDKTSNGREALVDKSDNSEVGFNQVDDLVQVLHKSARSFSIAIKSHELARSEAVLAKAWVGVDVHAWHKHIAYQAAVYALLKTATEVRFLLPNENSDLSLVHEILSPKISMLLEFIESELKARDLRLVEWFKIVKLPLLTGFFLPSFKRWSAEQQRSGVAAVILAISCCVAVKKLDEKRISCPSFTSSIPEVVGELMDLSHGLVPMDELHQLASESGFEQEFLSHFGAKVLPNKASHEVSFWVGLAQQKLAAAFHREDIISKMQALGSRQDLEMDLSVLGLFAFLGRSTRLFLLATGIKDLDEQVKDFLSFLECGGLFIYPELSALPVYQLFMEVVAEEIGWLDFYSSVPCISHHDRRRSKQHAIQAEKEIILSAVFSVCSDLFSGCAHFSNSTQQSLDTNMVTFLLRSRSLLTVCLEDYWAAYYRSGELLKVAERFIPQPVIPLENQGTKNAFKLPVARRKYAYSVITASKELKGVHISRMCKTLDSDALDAISFMGVDCNVEESKPECQSFFKKCTNKLIASSCAVMVGTQLLFIDISISMGLVAKRIRGHKLTERERKKLARTLADSALVIPVTILMLLPVSAVGHAALFAAIKKYIPSLIPSTYSSKRLGIVKQLNRTKKMEVQSWSNLENVSSMVS